MRKACAQSMMLFLMDGITFLALTFAPFNGLSWPTTAVTQTTYNHICAPKKRRIQHIDIVRMYIYLNFICDSICSNRMGMVIKREHWITSEQKKKRECAECSMFKCLSMLTAKSTDLVVVVVFVDAILTPHALEYVFTLPLHGFVQSKRTKTWC